MLTFVVVVVVVMFYVLFYIKQREIFVYCYCGMCNVRVLSDAFVDEMLHLRYKLQINYLANLGCF